MKYNIKDCIILILFIIIIYLLFTNDEYFTDGISTDGTITEQEKNIIKSKCDIITNNINSILKATNDSVNNNNNFQLKRTTTTFNDINTINSNVDNIYVTNNAHINIQYHIDNTNNTYTPTTKINIFPDYMIVAYNMIEQYNDPQTGSPIIENYNLPPGWVKCDGQTWYIFTDGETNERTAVNQGFHVLSEANIIKSKGYNKPGTSQYSIIETIYSQNQPNNTPYVTKIIAPDLRGRMVCGGGVNTSADDIDKFIFTDYKNEKQTTNSIGGQEYVKLESSHISHRHLTHMAINGAEPSVDKEYRDMMVRNYLISTQTIFSSPKGTSNNFLEISLTQRETSPTLGKFTMTTSDFYIKDGNPNKCCIPRNNMPPFYTLVYIMKIATVIIPDL